jgi:hypothetical protein
MHVPDPKQAFTLGKQNGSKADGLDGSCTHLRRNAP